MRLYVQSTHDRLVQERDTAQEALTYFLRTRSYLQQDLKKLQENLEELQSCQPVQVPELDQSLLDLKKILKKHFSPFKRKKK